MSGKRGRGRGEECPCGDSRRRERRREGKRGGVRININTLGALYRTYVQKSRVGMIQTLSARRGSDKRGEVEALRVMASESSALVGGAGLAAAPTAC